MPKSSKVLIKEIREVSNEYPYWQIKWLDEIETNYYTQDLMIEVHLLPLDIKEKTSISDINDLLRENLFVFNKSKVIKMSVGYLPVLTIGSIFYNGRFLFNPEYIKKTFYLSLTENSQQIFSLDDDFFDKDSRVDNFCKIFYLRKSKSRCLYYSLPDDIRNEIFLTDNCILRGVDYIPDRLFKGIIFPCIELMAYYYAVSSRMFYHLLTDGLGNTNQIFNEVKTIQPSPINHGHLRLSKNIPYSDVLVAAPIAFDPYTRKQARNIYISRLKSINENSGNSSAVKFPFEGETVLTVHGQPFILNNAYYFFAYWIEKCSKVPLFTDFGVWRDNAGSQSLINKNKGESFTSNKEDDEFIEGVINTTNYFGSREKENLLLTSTDSPSEFRKFIKISHPRHKFGALDNNCWFFEPDLEDIKGKTINQIHQEIIHTEQDMEIISASPIKGSKKVTEALLEMKEPIQPKLIDSDINENLTTGGKIFFSKLLRIISLLNRQVTVRPIFSKAIFTSDSNDKYHYGDEDSYFSSKFEEQELVWSNKTIDGTNRSLRIAELTFRETNYAYLFEIEPLKQYSENSKEDQHPLFLCLENDNFGKLSNSTIQLILSLCAKNNGLWLKNDQLKFLKRYKFKHSSKSYKRYAIRILTELRKFGWNKIKF